VAVLSGYADRVFEHMMLLMDVFVELWVVQQPMRPVEQRVVNTHAEEDLEVNDLEGGDVFQLCGHATLLKDWIPIV
tara:strand:+ start:306 stop:533 length:228 start_codon:yes stop_codon:yes gene_type:complete